MFEYCPNCRCRIKFYKAHECEKMKHDLADSVKLTGDAIANGEECKVKENTAHGFFRIWCNIKNIIEIICDIIKRMKCLQRKAQKVCEVQHCLAERIESVNRFIGVYNSDQANKPSPDQSDWEANKKRLESDYQTSLNGYNARKTEYDRALQAYNDSNSNYASALASYNARKAEYDRKKREYESGNSSQQGSQGQWQEAWGTFAKSGQPYDVAMGGSPNGSIHGLDLSIAHNAGKGRGVFFKSLNNEGTSVEIKLDLIGYSYEVGGSSIKNGYYVPFGGTYDWYLDYYVSTDGGNSYTPVETGVLLAKHGDSQNLAYGANWQASTINWSKTINLPSNFTHLKTEVHGDIPGERHQNVYTKEQIVRKPFPPFTEQPPVNNARRPEPFTEQHPQKPTIPPKPEKKVETIPLIKGGCDLMDCKFDCFIDNK